MQIRGVMIPALDRDPESDFPLFDDSVSGSNKKHDRNTSSADVLDMQKRKLKPRVETNSKISH